MLVSIRMPDGSKVPFDSLPEADQLRVRENMGKIINAAIAAEVERQGYEIESKV